MCTYLNVICPKRIYFTFSILLYRKYINKLVAKVHLQSRRGRCVQRQVYQKLVATTFHLEFPRDNCPICCFPSLQRYRTMQIYRKISSFSTYLPTKPRPNDGLSKDSPDVPLSSCSHIHTKRVADPDVYLQKVYRVGRDLRGNEAHFSYAAFMDIDLTIFRIKFRSFNYL